MDGPADPGASPAERVAELVDRIGTDRVVSWCADLLVGRVSRDDPDLPSLVWLGGRHAEALLEPDRLDPEVNAHWPRVWAARGLLHAWSAQAAPRVVDALADPAWRVREMAAKVAARWEVAEAADALLRLVGDDVPRVRAAAVRALGTVGEGEHGHAVRSALDDPEPAVARAAEAALTRLRRRLDREV